MDAVTFRFRRWVRRSCRRAMVWGFAALAGSALAIAWLRGPGETWNWDRGFGVLAAYGLLFWLTLAKIYWTAGKPAAALGDEALAYQMLHAFGPRRIPYRAVLAASPKPGTRSLRLLIAQRGAARELFLNLAVIDDHHAFMAGLGERLVAAGLAPVSGQRNAWAREGWERQPEVAGVGG